MAQMTRSWSWLLAGLVVVSVTAGCASVDMDEREQEVSIDEVPEAVRATMLAEAGDHTITEVEREVVGDTVVYEAEWMVDGKEVEINVAEDGTLLAAEADDDDDDDHSDDGDGHDNDDDD